MDCHLLGKTAILVSALLLWATLAVAAPHKVLYVDSYHHGYPWSAGITLGVNSVLADREGVVLKIVRMDTKRNPSEASKKIAALEVKSVIDSWRPDLVITSDDNAAKYLVVPYFKGSSTPFVFCGVNWSADSYGFPAPNVTGMIEVQLVAQILDTMRDYATGNRVAFLKGDDLSARKEAAFFEEAIARQLDKRFVTDFTEWKKQYLALQTQADMIFLGNRASINGWDDAEALAFVLANARVPSGGWAAWVAPFALLAFANEPKEQGEWAAKTALKILDGAAPSEIPVVTNQKATIYLNMEMAKKLNIKFPIELIERATFTSEMGLQ